MMFWEILLAGSALLGASVAIIVGLRKKSILDTDERILMARVARLLSEIDSHVRSDSRKCGGQNA
jgi:hypothetical protein